MREMDKVIGYENIKTELYRIIDIIRDPNKYKVLGVKIPRGIMFYGVPGIGKTLLANSFIKELNRNSFVVRKAISNGAFVDQIRETFSKAAKEEPAVILLDDIDKFANEDEAHRDADEYVTVQSCIDEYKDKNIFVVATCNNINCLPKSLVRRGRFDRMFSMSFPKNEDAEKIISFYLQGKEIADDIDVEEIVRLSEGRSCADLETVINEAGITAGYEGKDRIYQEDFRKACLRTFWGIKKRSDGCPAEIVRRKAIHEAGHATIIEHFYPGDVTFIAVNREHDAMVVRKKDDYRRDCFRNNEIEIMINLAGKAATELILGEIDMGTNRDLEKAFDGMASLLNDVAAYDFQSRCHGEETSQRVFDHLDDVTGVEIARYYCNTKQILMKNRGFLEALIEELIEKGIITYKDIMPLREKYLPNGKVA